MHRLPKSYLEDSGAVFQPLFSLLSSVSLGQISNRDHVDTGLQQLKIEEENIESDKETHF